MQKAYEHESSQWMIFNVIKECSEMGMCKDEIT